MQHGGRTSEETDDAVHMLQSRLDAHGHRLDLCWKTFDTAWTTSGHQEGLRMADTCCWRLLGDAAYRECWWKTLLLARSVLKDI